MHQRLKSSVRLVVARQRVSSLFGGNVSTFIPSHKVQRSMEKNVFSQQSSIAHATRGQHH